MHFSNNIKEMEENYNTELSIKNCLKQLWIRIEKNRNFNNIFNYENLFSYDHIRY